MAAQPDRCWQAEAQAGVAGQRCARHQQGARCRVQCFAGLAWPDQVDFMPGITQSLLQALHGEGNAVHFRRIGLGDDGIAHGGPPGFRHARPWRCSGHDGFATAR
ncbi:hypothetical protein G6F22_017662 [Rhizopus arrhizus]|nr:hypothetical protein G6F24_016857 [Rhizopus arrhizus]KAG0767352.1 hypothetical protein G6F22_017662 [Rhizopus arrhizus]KAG1373819.1 hypothetical protein G6F59_018465 [Rhizopus arrhizus]KAG1475761.1 hypothetical protein G6F54_014217 [Rhizopus delemar]